MHNMSEENLCQLYRNQPIEFFKDAWPGILIWDKHEEILNAIAEQRRIIVPSGHGVGKTWLMARVALWFLYCFYPSKVITTAPTWPQVEKLLWSEIKKAYNTSAIPLGGRILSTEIKIDEDWFAVGFSTKGKASEREFGTPRFQGYHSENLLVIIDEAPGVEHEIWTSIASLVTATNNKVIAIGNPTSPTGPFYDATKSELWNKVKISCFDHPNVKTNSIVIEGAVTTEWIEERRKEWGEDSPLWQTKILGEFPTEGDDTLIPLAWVEACVGLDLSREGERKLGVDVARKGNDKTAFCTIIGQCVEPIEAVNKKDTNYTIGRIGELHRENQYDQISVDDTGVGGGVTDGCEDNGMEVNAINFGERAQEEERFENIKAELYWNLREAIRDKLLSLPDDKELINQLCSIKYDYTRKQRIKIESKDDMRKRGFKSPDKADALAIAYSFGGTMKGTPGISIISVDDDV